MRSPQTSVRSLIRTTARKMSRKLAPVRPCLEPLETRDTPTGTYTGFVFQDFNANGIYNTPTTTAPNTLPNSGSGNVSLATDRLIGGVTVRAFDSTNTLRATTTSSATGAFSLDTTGSTGPYRVEFDLTTLPAGFVSGPHGAGANGSGTSVQFVDDGGGAGVNFGLVLPDDYSQDNPTLVSTIYNFGNQLTGPFANSPTVISFPYTSGALSTAAGTAPAPTTLATSSQVGSVYGLGQDRATHDVYAAAFMKKHVGFGPAGTGAIYKISGGVVSTFVDLNTVFGAGTAGADPHDTANYDFDNGNATWDAVGKISLGGLDVSPDGQFVFVMNLADRSLYRIPTSGPLNATTITRTRLPDPVASMSVTGTSVADPLGDLRPFAVQYYRGKLYVGAVNSAQSGGGAAALRAYIYEVDPTTLAFTATPVFQISDLTFTRGAAQRFNGTDLANWNPWAGGFSTVHASANDGDPAVYAQPILSGLAFDAAGNLTLGFKDRAGDQLGFFTQDNPAFPTRRYEGVAGGDMMFAAANTPNNLANGWTLEGNARVVTPGNVNNFGPTAGAGNGQGPGGGEYYFQDNYVAGTFHEETTGGGVFQLPGRPDVLSNAFDTNSAVRAGGFVWMSQLNGTRTKGYQVYASGNTNNPVNGQTFSKVNGTGELIALVDRPPIEIGNRVWRDTNGNGTQDAGELGIQGVTVRLFDAGGTQIGSTTTDGAGNYYFSSAAVAGIQPGVTLSARLDNAPDYATGGPLAGLRPTRFQTAGNVFIDSDGLIQTATDTRAGLAVGGIGASNHTADFGFTAPVSLGNQVFADLDNDGLRNGADAGTNGVLVELLFDADNNGSITGAELTTPVASATTATSGGVAGLYLFPNLLPGNYAVQIAASNFNAGGVLAGFISSTGTNGSATGNFEGAGLPDPDDNLDNRDDGNTAGSLGSGGVIRSGTITLAAGTEPTGESPGNDPGADAAGNLTLDFGVFRPLEVGNFVFNDLDNNGLFDGSDVGVNGVSVRLFQGATQVGATQTTAGGGAYLFTNLSPGAYRVEITAPAGFVSSTGTNGSATGTFEPVVGNSTTNNQDHGSSVGGGVVSANTLTLAAAGNAGNPDAGAGGANTANLRQDFGIFRPLELGNFVWRDTDNSGTLNGTEAGISGVVVGLLDSAGNPILDAANNPITATTNGAGNYLFPNLTPGTYFVSVLASNFAAGGPLFGLSSSTGPTGQFEPAVGNSTTDNEDHGTTQGDGSVRTNAVVLAAPGNAGNPDGGTGGTNAANLRQDFGFTDGAYSVGGFIYYDANNDGVRAAVGEPLITASTTITLTGFDSSGIAVSKSVTTTTGSYNFVGLRPSDANGYVITQTVQPAGYLDGKDTPGTPFGGAATNPGEVIQTVRILPGTPIDGTSNVGVNYNFGELLPASLGDFVWLDANGNGRQDGGAEAGIDGVTVTLNGANDLGTIAEVTVLTANGGQYGFTDLRPGTYTVAFGKTAAGVAYTRTVQNSGVATTPDDSNPNPATGVAPAVTLVAGQSDPTIDQGLYLPVTVGDLVWYDIDGDGTKNGTEPGIPNVKVTVTWFGPDGVAGGNDDVTFPFATTDANGLWQVTGLPPGKYSATVDATTLPLGLTTQTFDRDGLGTPNTGSNTVAVPSGGSDLLFDFGYRGTASLGNRVWLDINGDGVQDDPATEPPLPGVQVRLTWAGFDGILGNTDDVVIGTKTTSTATAIATGNYTFTNLPGGKFRTDVVSGLPGNVTQTYDLDGTGSANSAVRVLGNTENAVDVDFGYRGDAAIGDLVWYDVDGNQAQNNAEPGIPNVPVSLVWAGPDGILGNADDVTFSITTDTNGKYLFTNLPAPLTTPGANNYRVTVTQPGTYPARTFDADGVNTPNTSDLAIAAGQTNLLQDFGYRGFSGLGDFVWLDANGNGVQDQGEAGVNGITVELLDAGGNVLAVTTTANDGLNDGAYSFDGLAAGTYSVRFGNTAAGVTYTRTVLTSPGGDDTTDSDADRTTGTTRQVTLGSEEFNPDIDQGLVLLASVGDTVWFDADNSATQNGTEPGVGGVTVLLDYAGPDGAFDGVNDQLGVATQVTAADGTYLFPNLFPGTYRVRVDATTLPAGLDAQTYDLDGLASANKADFPLASAEDRRDVDFGYRGTASLGDTVWYDIDKSGTQNNNEPGINGVTVNLIWAGRDGNFGTADDFTFAPQVTGADGKYLFPNLPAGNFRAAVDTTTLPAGVTVNTYDLDSNTTNPNSTADTTLTAGQNRVDVDFGYTGAGFIGDRVWLDSDADGAQDQGEPGIVGATVTLTWFGPDGQPGGNDDVTLTATTGADGIYGFPNLPPGNYLVQVTATPAGLRQTGDPDNVIDAQSNVTIGTGETNLLQDFGYTGNSSLAGNVYVDLNDDGLIGGAETRLPNVTVTLTGTDALGNAVSRTTTTDGTGAYSFANLVPGTYQLNETQPALYGDGKDTVGSLNGTTTNDQFAAIPVGVNQNGTEYNFGERPGTISGVVFYDANRDGDLGPNENPLPNVTVTLLDGNNQPVATTQTLPDGSYQFTNLPAGNYSVVETQPAGYGDPATGPFSQNTRPVTLPPGGSVPDQNFGDTLSSIAGSVYVDLNENGVRDPNEPGIANVTVTLTGTTPAGSVNVSVQTGPDGSYFFGDLQSGTYQLVENQPNGFVDGKEAVGTPAGGTLVSPDTIAEVSLPAGVDAVRYTFGEVGAGVSGVSYHDRNQNGVYDPGTDTPLANVTVTLVGPRGFTQTTTTANDGSYSFLGIPSGNYTLTETQPTGYGNSETPTNTRSVTVPPGTVVPNQNFGNTLGSIAGVVYVDYNLSSVYDPTGNPGTDTPLGGITVTLRDANGNVVATTQTAGDGTYFFGGLPLGSYTVTEAQPPLPVANVPGGYYDGADNLGSLGGTQPVKNQLGATIGVDPNTGVSQNGVQYNFGELPPADPFGFVYNDLNRNGNMDPGEPGIPGVTVTLTGTSFFGTPFATPLTPLTVTTDANGRYEFNPIPPGLYTITETQPAGFIDGIDRNGDPNPPFTVVAGNDVFSNIDLSPFPIRGPFLFGEYLGLSAPPTLPPFDFFPTGPASDISKRQFLSTIDTSTGGTTAPVGPTLPNFAAFGASVNRPPVFAAIAEDAGNGWVRVFDFGTGNERFRFQPYGDFAGGVRVATGDVTGDGIPDIVTVPGVGGGPLVKVFDGNTGAEVRSIMAFESTFRGGLQVAVADLTGDGRADLLVTPDTGGGPILRAFDGATGGVIANFFAIDDANFRGGLRVAAGDVNKDGTPDVIVTAGIGGGPRVAGYDGKNLGTTRTKVFADYFAFAPELRNGFWAAVGDTDGDGFSDVIIGAGTGGSPRVGVYSGQLLSKGGGTQPVTSFFAGEETSRSGARVRAIDLDNDARVEVIAAGEAGTLPTVFIYNPLTGARRDQFYGFPTNDLGGVYVG